MERKILEKRNAGGEGVRKHNREKECEESTSLWPAEEIRKKCWLGRCFCY
jgi:hypothetical protein